MISELKSGQEIYLSVINTNAGSLECFWYVKQYWCDSGMQKKYKDMGLLFTDKDDAINQSKMIFNSKPKNNKTEWVKGLSMISKDKLLNAYVNTKDKELRKEWYKACEHYGFNMEYFYAIDDYKFSFVADDGDIDFCNDDHPYIARKTELNLSDFKPKKTRTEWVKVEDSIFDLRPDFECGELYYKNGSEYIALETLVQLVSSLEYDNCYRKVEKKIDWRNELADSLKMEKKNGMYFSSGSYVDFNNGSINMLLASDDITEQDFIRACHLVAELTDKPE